MNTDKAKWQKPLIVSLETNLTLATCVSGDFGKTVGGADALCTTVTS
jgi:hypothetical protein